MNPGVRTVPDEAGNGKNFIANIARQNGRFIEAVGILRFLGEYLFPVSVRSLSDLMFRKYCNFIQRDFIWYKLHLF